MRIFVVFFVQWNVLNIFITFFRACKYISNSVSRPSAMDWRKCVTYQDKTTESLQCPADLSRSKIQVGAGHNAFIQSLNIFVQLNALLVDIDVFRLDDGSGMVQMLMQNKTKWHATC